MDTASPAAMPADARLNGITSALADIFERERAREKWLLAPSRRIAQQWLDAIARAGRRVLNVHLFTLPSLALELAASELAERGWTAALGEELDWWADLACQTLPDEDRGPLTSQARLPGLAAALRTSLEDLRLCRLGADRLTGVAWDQADKGRELAALLDRYLQLLADHDRVDYAGVLELASDAVRRDGLPRDVLLLAPQQMETCEAERQLLAAIEPARLQRPQADRPETDRGDDLSLLSWIDSPADAPPPRRDGTADLFRAVGECNEIREVLRRVVAAGIPLDEVELLHLGSDPYVPLLIELSQSLGASGPGGLLSDEGEDDQREAAVTDAGGRGPVSQTEPRQAEATASSGTAGGFPLTVAEGVPAIYSRPGRALVLWLRWSESGCSQRLLLDLIQEGLWGALPTAEQFTNSQFARLLRETAIGRGRERYLPALDERIAAERAALRAERAADDPQAWRRRQLIGLRLLRRHVKRLLEITPDEGNSPAEVLAKASRFLADHVRVSSQLDRAARNALGRRIARLADWLELTEVGQWDALGWLQWVASHSPLLGSGPRPGALHVAHALSGGHSLRPVTFVLGLDDTRFPGSGRQDPVLLDHQRQRLSESLSLAIDDPQRRTTALAETLARLRGAVTLSCPAEGLADDRLLFPSPVLDAALRILDLEENEPDAWRRPVSFAPRDPAQAVSETEWWLSRICPAPGEAAAAEVAARFPHLARGAAAQQTRLAAEISEFNGWVPQAAELLSPFTPGRAWSASAMERAGRCPLQFFYRYGLGVQVTEDPPGEEDRWLNPPQFGRLLHAVFRQFMSELAAADDAPDFDRHHLRLAQILRDAVDRQRTVLLPPSESQFRQQVRQLRRAAAVFLQDEQRHCQGRIPRFFETAVGSASEHPTPLDVAEPLMLSLDDGRRLPATGHVDRVDQLADAPHQFEVWDYKTGSDWAYDAKKPFGQGRHVQNAFYLQMVDLALQQLEPGAEVVRFGYFFPGSRTWGKRISWTADELREGRAVLRLLAEVMASGVYLPTFDSKQDCRYCDYRDACGPSDEALLRLTRASERQAEGDGTDRIRARQELRDVP